MKSKVEHIRQVVAVIIVAAFFIAVTFRGVETTAVVRPLPAAARSVGQSAAFGIAVDASVDWTTGPHGTVTTLTAK